MKVLQRFALAIGMCIACSFAAHFAEAQETELKTSAVAAFKNGLAFVVKETYTWKEELAASSHFRKQH